MKLPLTWLKEFVSIKEPAAKLAEKLSLSSFAVEAIEDLGQRFEKIVVGQIKTIHSHPSASKLQVAIVSIGRQKLEIVCGGPNIKVGQKVPVALEGTRLPNGLVIAKTKIRGVDSEAMLCSGKELGLNDDQSGIYILPQKSRIGSPLAQALGLNEVVFDLDITPNRPDCFSVLGLAREIGAIYGLKLKNEPEGLIRIKKKSAEQSVSQDLAVRVNDKNLCPKYTACLIRNVKVAESPDWLKSRLISIGLTPINNLVDIANYVMMELGQPLHAFDAAKVTGKSIIVRPARKGEKIICLDDQERILDQGDLVIADSRKALAIAGVIGGRDSAVAARTKEVILESAIFKPSSIRKTARKLGIRTEASIRFEKGIDWQLPAAALNRVAGLILKLGAGEVVPGIISIAKEEIGHKKEIKLPLAKIWELLNQKMPLARIKKILTSLGCQVVVTEEQLKVGIPSFRPDLKIPEDLIEEIARLYGYNNLKPTFLGGSLKPVKTNRASELVELTRDILVGLGLNEVYNYSFYGQPLIQTLGLDEKPHLKVANSLNPDQEYLRVSLIPHLLTNGDKNLNLFDEIKIFELGHIYLAQDRGFEEKKMLAGLSVQRTGSEFYRVKGIVELLLEKLGVGGREISFGRFDREETLFDQNEGVLVKIGKEVVGRLGELKPALEEELKFPRNVGIFELDLNKLLKHLKLDRIYESYSLFPRVLRDISLVVDQKIDYLDLLKAIEATDNLITKVELFDVYEGKGIGLGKKSLSFHIYYQAPDRTLKAEEVDQIQKKIEDILMTKWQINIRK